MSNLVTTYPNIPSPPLSAHDITSLPAADSSFTGTTRQRPLASSPSTENGSARDTKRRRQNNDGSCLPEISPAANRVLSSTSSQKPLEVMLAELAENADSSSGFDYNLQSAAPHAPAPVADLTPPELDSHSAFAPATFSFSSGVIDSSTSASAIPRVQGQYGRARGTSGIAAATTSGPPKISIDTSARTLDPSNARPPADSPTSKDKFVSGLVGATVIAIESIWGIPSPSPSDDASSPTSPTDSSVLPLQWFVREVLRRSRTSCSTLQVSLFYLHKCRREIRDTVARAEAGATMETMARATAAAHGVQSTQGELVTPNASSEDAMHSYPSPPTSPVEAATAARDRFANVGDAAQSNPILCGRRMFLAALICASKFLQDRNYSNRAWAKISGLAVKEINDNERVFLGLMKFQLHLGAEDFQRWTERLASLATQGAALESASSTPQRARFGLARHASEYPPAPPLQQMQHALSSSSHVTAFGRAQSHSAVQERPNPAFPAVEGGHALLRPLAGASVVGKRSAPSVQQTVTPMASPMQVEETPSSSLSVSPEALSYRKVHRRPVAKSKGLLAAKPTRVVSKSTSQIGAAFPIAKDLTALLGSYGVPQPGETFSPHRSSGGLVTVG